MESLDQGTGDCSQGQSTTATDDIIVKLELPWSLEEELQDEPSAVYSTVQPMSDNTSGSLLSLNTSHACQRCSAVFMSSSSLQIHLETFHGETLHSELPVASRLQDSAGDNTDKMPSGQERLSTQVTDDSRDDSVTSSKDFTIKLEPAWSMKEEPQDEPSAVYSTVQPMSDNTSGSLPTLNSSHVCQRCFASFVLFSSLELHLATFHGESPHGFLVYSGNNGVDVGHHHGSKVENGGNYNNQKAVKERGEKVEDSDSDSDSDRTDQERIEWDHAYHLSRSSMPSTATGKVQPHAGFKPFVCDVCNKAFGQSGHLMTHKMTHTGYRPFVCDVCGAAFSRAHHLKTHAMIHTGVKPFVCDVCQKGFIKGSALTRHRRVHTGERPYKCEYCSAAFNVSNNLQSHVKAVHETDRPHVCDVCGEAFAKPFDYERHYKMHTGEKPYMCDVCEMAFSTTGHLKQHKRMHTGEKPYKCADCGRRFAWSSNLKDHQLTHTGEKPYACPRCPAAFTRSGHLKRHVQTVHEKL